MRTNARAGIQLRRRVVAGLVALAASVPALAGAMPVPLPGIGAAAPVSQLTVDGVVEVHDARIVVRCRTARTRARCVVTLGFEAMAQVPSTIHLPRTLGTFRVDGEAVPDHTDAFALASGEKRTVTLRMRRALWEGRSGGRYLMPEAMMTRHVWLGEFEDIDRSGNLEELSLFAGAGWRLVGDVRVRHERSRRIRVHVAGQPMPTRVEARLSALPQQVDVALEGPRETPRWLRRGGPLLMLGYRVGEGGGWQARGGYEAGFGRHGFLSCLVETDFHDDLALVALLEGATPAPLYIVPSLSAGFGLRVAVLDDPHVALRFSLGVNTAAQLGLQGTLDWDPRDHQVRAALAGRLSF